MNLPARTLGLKTLVLKDKPVLALDTGFAGDSLESLRLVKASRGAGWLFHAGRLVPWITKGVVQEDGRLVIWGEAEPLPEAIGAESWPLTGAEGREFLRAFVVAWTALSAEPLPPFSSSAVIPARVAGQWAFVFPPAELRSVLDSLQPLSERLAWEHFKHPDLGGAASWAFTSAALGVHIASGELPWTQDTEEHLRQEIRDLKRTFSTDELPEGPDGTTLTLWADGITGRGSQTEARWKAWALEDHPWNSAPADPVRAARGAAARARRLKRRSGAAFLRSKGTLLTALGVTLGVLALIVGTVVWGAIQPHPSDDWTPAQVVQGYYAALEDLDADLLKRIVRGQDPELVRDQEESTNLYVIRQVRIGYERQSPVLKASDWEAAGKPPLEVGKMLHGLAGLVIEGQGTTWTASYRKWNAEGDETGLRAVGAALVDRLTLEHTPRGWKVVSLERTRQPLP